MSVHSVNCTHNWYPSPTPEQPRRQVCLRCSEVKVPRKVNRGEPDAD